MGVGRREALRLMLTAAVGASIRGLEAGEIGALIAQELEVEVDRSANRVYVYRNGSRIRSYLASVGQPSYETPAGSYRISSIVWNPWWHPPESEWARDREPVPPGPNNPMGRVKLNFAPLYYIHGTPETGKLGEPVSHGCVRLTNEHAIELARMVMEVGAPGIGEEEIDALLRNTKNTRTISLAHPVPLKVNGA